VEIIRCIETYKTAPSRSQLVFYPAERVGILVLLSFRKLLLAIWRREYYLLMKIFVRALIWILTIAGCSLSAEPIATNGFAWKKGLDSVALIKDGQVVWQFNHGSSQTKPNFHPLALPNGPVLTWDRPADHVWHRALWFSWKFINGINYWEEDPKTGQAAGKTEWQAKSVVTSADFSSLLVLELAYHPPGKPPVLTEQRSIRISAPDDKGEYHLDWDMTFIAGPEEVLLDRTPLPNEKDGKPYGGYAGLSVRFAKEMESPIACGLDGLITFQEGRYRGRSGAMDYSGLFAGREGGIAMVDHLRNLNAPSPWYIINDNQMRYFSPALLCYQPCKLGASEHLTLRYRVIVHPGRWNGEHLRSQLNWWDTEPTK
jgi:hypothetical protein